MHHSTPSTLHAASKKPFSHCRPSSLLLSPPPYKYSSALPYLRSHFPLSSYSSQQPSARPLSSSLLRRTSPSPLLLPASSRHRIRIDGLPSRRACRRRLSQPSPATGKEIWEKLIIAYEETNEVRLSRINILVREYELFTMNRNETISEMYTRFTKIINSLHALGKEFSSLEKVSKILRSLPREWESKVTAIMEAKDLESYSLDVLLGSLIAYEQGRGQRDEEEKGIKRSKQIALKSKVKEVSSSSASESSCNDDDIVLMTRKFKTFLKGKKHKWDKRQLQQQQSSRRSGKNFNESNSNSNNAIVCYECKKPGHVRWSCPLLSSNNNNASPSTSHSKNSGESRDNSKKKHYKKRAFWADSESSSSDEDCEKNGVHNNLALMARTEEEEIHVEEISKEECFHVKKNTSVWYLDSGCSKHMTGSKDKFNKLEMKDGGKVTLGDNSQRKVIGIGSIDTGRGKLSEESSLKGGKNTKHGSIPTITYRVGFCLEADFGVPGAIVVKNGDRKEFYLHSVTVEFVSDRGGEANRAHFNCRSWVYPVKRTNADRIFFSITSYLPSQTPEAIQKLRQEELERLRGNGRGERKKWERIYDYDYYNDLGDPSKGEGHERPVLGGSKSYPYPRRLRTGRPLSETDHRTETKQKMLNLDFYVPPDERFSHKKLTEFISSSIQAVAHFVLPEVVSLFQGSTIGNFESFDQISKDLYKSSNKSRALERIVVKKLKELLPDDLFNEAIKAAKNTPTLKFPIPQVIQVDQLAWKTDEEFAREMLAGLNPVLIRRLEAFPPVGKDGRQSSILPSHIRNNLDGLSIKQAMDQKRIFILDHHDYLTPYLRRINAQGECIYASRTLLLKRDNGTLKPLVIELSLPGEEGSVMENSRVFLPAIHGIEGALWQLAKTHVSINDSGYHQLTSHWLHTHAVVEPFIIATRRQLSVMHPVHKLLDPHFKDTMHINSLARSILLNAGGILEKTMFPRKFSMELSSTMYENWRFEEQGLPFDLLNRGIAVEDFSHPTGVRLLLEDYPYAADGLDVWCAIRSWVSAYCTHFYISDAAVAADTELHSWWLEIRLTGHGDLPPGALRPALESLSDLVLCLTTLIWLASALHAAVNFGQFAYAGYPPARPTRSRRFIPAEGSPEFAQLVRDPDRFFMETIPDRFTATLGVALVEVLSRHAGEEAYLGRRAAGEGEMGDWTDDAEVVRMFGEFGEELRRVETRIEERNGDSRLVNRRGPVGMVYTLMYPDTGNDGSKEKGITGKGIPNSVSI